jgi:hypothetical protein
VDSSVEENLCSFYFSLLDTFSQMTKTWWEAPMGGSVLSFLKAE